MGFSSDELIGYVSKQVLMTSVNVEGTNKKLVINTKILEDFDTVTYFQVFDKQEVVFSTNDLKVAVNYYERI